MVRRKVGSRGSGKAVIRVFCEGESEQAYTEFLKKRFSDVEEIEIQKKFYYLQKEDKENKDF
ncbi:hypothetical protein DXB46_10515 [Lachnospiraceae bacterium OM04-12BH]|nr:hypothetical protein DXB46_10515 [Lachnospiraceae bacterium OM04-12BH]